MMKSPRDKYRFDGVEFNPSNLQLTVNGAIRVLEPKSYRLLEFLLVNAGRVAGKEEILRAVWEETAVSDNALTRSVAQIRKALEDDPKDPRYIETVPTVGYRFIGVLKEEEEAQAAPRMRAAPVQRSRTGLWVGMALVFAAGVGAWSLERGGRPHAPVVLHPLPFTAYEGSEDGASFSPDGNQMAFHWNGEKEDNWDIYVKSLGPDSMPVRLTADAKADQWPAWSPDGRSIAFIHTENAERFALMVIPALGGAARRLAEFPYQTDKDGVTPAWSSDSKWLLVPALHGSAMSVFRVSLESGEATAITDPGSTMTDRWPSVSPDGRTLLFTRGSSFSAGDLYTVALDANAKPVESPRRVRVGNLRVGTAKWTADGKEIVAMVQRGGVYRFPAEGTDYPVELPWAGTSAGWIELSRQGNRMAYSSMRGDGHMRGDANVWRIDLQATGAAPEKLIASTFRDAYPQYSPDGKRMAFYSRRSGSQQTYVANADGSQARQITFEQTGSAVSATWSPDGKMLVLDSNSSGLYQLYKVSAEGGKLTQLTAGSGLNFGATWSRDGQWLYFCSNRTGRNEVWKIPVVGGEATQVTRNGGVKAVESEDGTILYYSKDTGTGSIWRMPLGGGAEEQLVSSLFRLNFALSRQGLYYMTAAGDDGTAELKLYHLPGGTTTTVWKMGRPEFGLDVSPDGRYLVYAQLDDSASDLMLVENFR